MNEKKDMIEEIIAAIIVVIIALSIDSLIFWGLGNLTIYIFKLNAIWTIWHGLYIAIIYRLLKGMFNVKQ